MRAVDPVFQTLGGGLRLVQIGARLVQLCQRFAAEFAARLVDLALHFLAIADCARGMARVVPSS
jgi:hypothetical protein